MQTVLITGINGFLGSSLAKALSDEYNVIGLEYSLENLFRIAEFNYKVYSAKNGIPDEVFKEQRIDIIIHTATFYGRNNEAFTQIFDANLYSPFTLLDKAILNGCKLYVNTDTVLDRFVSTYALTKRQFQEWLYLRKNEINVINMQLEHFYGPGASSSNFITSMISKLMQNESKIDLTLGEQFRDFVYIDDIVTAYCKALGNGFVNHESYLSYYVGTGSLISIKDLLFLMKDLTFSKSTLVFGAIPYRENEIVHSDLLNRSNRPIGWNPKTTLREGISKTIDHYENQKNS